MRIVFNLNWDMHPGAPVDQDTAASPPDRTARKRRAAARTERMLNDVPLDEEVVLVRLDVESVDVEALLEKGFVPGCTLCPVRRSPTGGPTIYRVDGHLVALRKETASCLCVRKVLTGAGAREAS